MTTDRSLGTVSWSGLEPFLYQVLTAREPSEYSMYPFANVTRW